MASGRLTSIGAVSLHLVQVEIDLTVRLTQGVSYAVMDLNITGCAWPSLIDALVCAGIEHILVTLQVFIASNYRRWFVMTQAPCMLLGVA